MTLAEQKIAKMLGYGDVALSQNFSYQADPTLWKIATRLQEECDELAKRLDESLERAAQEADKFADQLREQFDHMSSMDVSYGTRKIDAALTIARDIRRLKAEG